MSGMLPHQEIILGACQVICQVLAEEALDRLDGIGEQDRIALKTMLAILKDHTLE